MSSIKRGYGEIFKEHRVTPKKRFGQHFMIDPGLLLSLSEIMVPESDYVAMEIGAGAGTLTKDLCSRAKWVHAVELDKDLMPVAQDITRGIENLSWHWQDVLEKDLSGAHLNSIHPNAPLCLCGNLPYYLTSEILYRSLIERSLWQRMAFVVQLEVGERICAKEGSRDFGRLSLWCQYRAKVSLERTIPGGAFMPRPDVESCLVLLEIKEEFPLSAEQEIFMDDLAKNAYSKRRKTLLNGISDVFPHLSKVCLARAMEDGAIDPNRRPETFGPSEFADLAKTLWPLARKNP